MPHTRSIFGGLILAVMTVPASLAFASTPKSVTLKLTDLPSGFKERTAMVVSNKLETGYIKVSKSAVTKHGRVTGYISEFVHIPVTLEVSSLTSRYKSVGGAHWEYMQSRKVYLKKGPKAVSAPRVGGESVAFTERVGAGKAVDHIYGVIFHKGLYTGTITLIAVGTKSKGSIADAVHYARIVAKRA